VFASFFIWVILMVTACLGSRRLLKELHDYEEEKYTVIHITFNPVNGLGSNILDVHCELEADFGLDFEYC
jgi:hypothetical protein